jgi:fluoroacetyl-CoA thioesterase
VFEGISAGLACERSVRVERASTAAAIDSGNADVFSTPSMITLMEQASRDAVQDLLPAGWTTVGTAVDIRHLSATPVGELVTARSVLKEIDGRRMVFEVSASDRLGVIGAGVHERFAVELGVFMNRLCRRFCTEQRQEQSDV